MQTPQLDELLQLPEQWLVLVGGNLDDPRIASQGRSLQYYDVKAGGWGRLHDMTIGRYSGCAAAALGASLYVFGGEGFVDAGPYVDAGLPYCMSVHELASRRWRSGPAHPGV